MDRDTLLDSEVLVQLGFQYNGDCWFHSEEPKFAIKLENTCFYVTYHGYLAQYRYEPRVEVLEKQFFESTGKLLF